MAHESDTFPFTLLPRSARGRSVVTADQRDAFIRRFTVMGDPAADKVVEMLRRLPPGEGRRMFELAVEQGIDAVAHAPDELAGFFGEVDAVPVWVDADQLDLGARVIGRTGVVGFMALAMGALMGGYAASRVTKPLALTGDLDRMAPRRIAETTSWLVAVSAPGGLERFAPGFQGTLRVRLMHALVRAGMARRSDWRWDAWDRPVNQSQMSGTIMLFAVATVCGSQALGLHFDRRERDAVHHLFRYVGWLMGVSVDILPTSEADAWRLLSVQAEYEFGHPDRDGRKLAQALVRAIGPLTVRPSDHLPQRVAREAATGFLCAYARRILGTSSADFLGLDDNKLLQALVSATATAIRCLEMLRRAMPGATLLCEAYGRRSWVTSAQRMMAQHNGDCSYSRHDRLADTTPRPHPPTSRKTGHKRPNLPAQPHPSSPTTNRSTS